MRPATLWPRADCRTLPPHACRPRQTRRLSDRLDGDLRRGVPDGHAILRPSGRPPEAAHNEHPPTFGGLSATADGYTMRLPDSTGTPGDDQFVELEITGPGGGPVPDYTETDGAPMHVIAVRRDLSGYQHIYPEQGEGASWWAVLNLTPGPWRLIAEFRPATLGRPVVLGADLTISGKTARDHCRRSTIATGWTALWPPCPSQSPHRAAPRP